MNVKENICKFNVFLVTYVGLLQSGAWPYGCTVQLAGNTKKQEQNEDSNSSAPLWEQESQSQRPAQWSRRPDIFINSILDFCVLIFDSVASCVRASRCKSERYFNNVPWLLRRSLLFASHNRNPIGRSALERRLTDNSEFETHKGDSWTQVPGGPGPGCPGPGCPGPGCPGPGLGLAEALAPASCSQYPYPRFAKSSQFERV